MKKKMAIVIVLLMCGMTYAGFYFADIKCDICAHDASYQYYSSYINDGFVVYTPSEPYTSGSPELRFFHSEIRVCGSCKAKYQQRYQECMSFAHNKVLKAARKEQAATRAKNLSDQKQTEISEITAKIAELKKRLAEKANPVSQEK